MVNDKPVSPLHKNTRQTFSESNITPLVRLGIHSSPASKMHQ